MRKERRVSLLLSWGARQQQRGRQDHYSFPVELHGRNGKVRASLLPPKSTADIFEARNGRNVGASYLPPRYAQTAGTFSIAPAS